MLPLFSLPASGEFGMRVRVVWLVWPLVALTGLSGCSGKNPGHAERMHLATLARVYGFYIRTNKGAPPKSMSDLKQFVKSMTATDLQQAGITDPSTVDTMFTS